MVLGSPLKHSTHFSLISRCTRLTMLYDICRLVKWSRRSHNCKILTKYMFKKQQVRCGHSRQQWSSPICMQSCFSKQPAHSASCAESQAVMSSSGVAMQYIAPRQSSAIDPRNLVNGSGEAILPESHAATNEASSSQKYAKKRGLYSYVRSLFAPSLLPITTRCDFHLLLADIHTALQHKSMSSWSERQQWSGNSAYSLVNWCIFAGMQNWAAEGARKLASPLCKA